MNIAKPYLTEVVTPPSASIVPMADFKAHLGDTTDTDDLVARKLETATQWVEDMTGLWWRRVVLRAFASAVPDELRLPGGRVDPSVALTGEVVSSNGSVSMGTTVTPTLQADAGGYWAVIPEGTPEGSLTVDYVVDPGAFVPAPVQEAAMKLGAHLLDVRGASPKGEATGSVGLGLSPSMASEVALLLKAHTRKLP